MIEKGFLRSRSFRAPRRRGAGRIVIAVTGVVLAAAAAARLLLSPAVALSRFEIDGSRHARTRDVVVALEPFRGRNLVLLDLRPVSAAVERVPWVGRVTVTKEFPDALRISISEKTPAALLRAGDTLEWLDAKGGRIAAYDAREMPGDFPVITAADDRLADAAALLESLRKVVPDYARTLSEIWALPSGGFGMMDSVFRVPIQVIPGDAPKKIEALLALREEIDSRGLTPRAIDLRFERRVVLVGAIGGGKRI